MFGGTVSGVFWYMEMLSLLTLRKVLSSIKFTTFSSCFTCEDDKALRVGGRVCLHSPVAVDRGFRYIVLCTIGACLFLVSCLLPLMLINEQMPFWRNS